MTALTKAIRQIAFLQALLLLTWLFSFELFINIEIAFFSAFFVLLGSMYSYSELVRKRVEGYAGTDERDAVEKIEDPYDLYEEENGEAAEASPGQEKEEAAEPVDLKAVIKEEKQRIKATGGVKNMKKTAPAMVSLYRLIPYGILVVGFIGLKNNGVLSLWPYLIGLGLGIGGGLIVGRGLFGKENL
jgi:hypothetical protein